MTSTSHQQWERAVEACLDGELARAEDDAVRQHLQDCPDCDGHARLMLAVRTSLCRVVRYLPPLTGPQLQRLADHLAAHPTDLGRPR